MDSLLLDEDVVVVVLEDNDFRFDAVRFDVDDEEEFDVGKSDFALSFPSI